MACGYTTAEIDDMRWSEIIELYRYWQTSPPIHETLRHVAAVLGVKFKEAPKTPAEQSGMSVAVLRAMFPDGLMRA
jgi:hypothetical protein